MAIQNAVSYTPGSLLDAAFVQQAVINRQLITYKGFTFDFNDRDTVKLSLSLARRKNNQKFSIAHKPKYWYALLIK